MSRSSPSGHILAMSVGRSAAWLFVIGLGGIGMLWACSNSVEVLDPGDAGTDALVTDDQSIALPDVHEEEAGACARHCSSDLHTVLDCTDAVVETCPADQGCGGASCVPACDAAKANGSSVGCDYVVVQPDTIFPVQGACYAAFVVNTWTEPVALSAEWSGQSLSIGNATFKPSGSGSALTYTPLTNGKLQPGEVAIIFLNSFNQGGLLNIECPTGITPALTAFDGAIHGTGIGKAFHIASSRPVAAYDVMPFGGGSSLATGASLLLPTTAWDTNYVAVNAFAQSSSPDEQNFLAIAASEDGTSVTISPTADVKAGSGVLGTNKGQPRTYALNKGEYLQLTQDGELTGSIIQSNKPVGVWGGATCFNVDIAEEYCDTAHQQLVPVSALGHEYTAVRYRDRYVGTNEVVPWRIVGAVDGTTLAYEPATPPGAPLTIGEREVKTFWAPGPFVVHSQDDKHPFYVAQYMTSAHDPRAGGSTDGGPSERGDPEFVNVVPPAQFMTSYVFFTDPTYPETNLVVVRTKGSSGFADVELDCAGKLGGWQALGSSGTYEYTRLDLASGNFAPVGGCDNGRHEIHSTAPFGVTIWGWGSEATDPVVSTAVSYAYPAGARLRHITSVVVPPDPK